MIRNIVLKFVLGINIVVVLVACAHQPFFVKSSDNQTTSSVSQCKVVCQQRLELCNKTCRNNYVQCSVYSCATRLRSYHKYMHEQCIQGEKIIRQLNSYRDPLQCRKTTCNCKADFQVCKQSCRGKLHTQLLEPSVCQ